MENKRNNRNHPWRRDLTHNGKENYHKLSDERYKTMMASGDLIVNELKKDPLYQVDSYPWIGRTIKKVIRVRIANKVYMLDRYLPDLGEKLGKLLEEHHWKWKDSYQRLCGMEYFIVPDWEYWLGIKGKNT